jgi:2-polyprenyl-3-methyl-5-hydroxy-6-metoxy-1,4-benzoquinol methylase
MEYSKRLNIAECSGGISENSIYSMIVSFIRAADWSGNLLELGAGKGNLIKILAPSLVPKCVIHCIDITPRPFGIPDGVFWKEADLNLPLEYSEGYFNFVISSEVIEHLENPRAFFRECSRIIKSGGVLILTTPNNRSLRSTISLLFRGHFVAFSDSCYPAHITALLEKDLSRLCTEVGFTMPEFSYTDHGYIPGLTAYLWQKLSTPIFKGRLFSDNLMMVSYKI